jgi:hypothetical protein
MVFKDNLGLFSHQLNFALWVWDMAYKAVKNEIIKYINNNDL